MEQRLNTKTMVPPIGVDIAIPCYQYGRFLRDCVTSVLMQEIRDLRVLIIDNASTDDSVEVAQQLAAEDRRVEIVVHPRNLGHHASFNEAIDWASSKYFMILCADDLLVPGCLARSVSFMEKHPEVNLTYRRHISISARDPVPHVESNNRQEDWQIWSGREFLYRLCRAGGRIGLGPTIMVRTSVQKNVGYYRSELPYCDDLEMWLRFACHGAAAETDAVQVIQRYHAGMRSAAVSDVLYAGLDWELHIEAAFASFFATEGASMPRAKFFRQTACRTIASRAYWAAWANFVRGDARQSFRYWRFALVRRPTTVFVPPVSYLFQTPGAFNHIIQVMSDALRQTIRITNDFSPSQR
jgi:glycosyltransferase involved in cell wall biosynthesis